MWITAAPSLHMQAQKNSEKECLPKVLPPSPGRPLTFLTLNKKSKYGSLFKQIQFFPI
jgi:hypothetical protein